MCWCSDAGGTPRCPRRPCRWAHPHSPHRRAVMVDRKLIPSVTALAMLLAVGAVRDVQGYDAGFDAFWELDFFGRNRRALEASRATEQAATANLQDAQVSVVAELTRSYFELRGNQQRLEVARRNVANQNE